MSNISRQLALSIAVKIFEEKKMTEAEVTELIEQNVKKIGSSDSQKAVRAACEIVGLVMLLEVAK